MVSFTQTMDLTTMTGFLLTAQIKGINDQLYPWNTDFKWNINCYVLR